MSQLFPIHSAGLAAVGAPTSGETVFEVSDVAARLGLSDEVVRTHGFMVARGDEQFVSLLGVFNLLMRSDADAAKRFRLWLVFEVLPALFTMGGYLAASPFDSKAALEEYAGPVIADTMARCAKEVAHGGPLYLPQ